MTALSSTNRKPRRMTREAQPAPILPAAVQKTPSKLDVLADLLARDEGASIAGMMAATGWQAHSVRGAMAGALKKRRLAISSTKSEGERRYKAVQA